MHSQSELFQQLERRARNMRAVRYAAILAAGCAAVFLTASSLMLIWPFAIPYAVLIVIGSTVSFGLVGLLLGMRLPIHLPTILLRADVALELDAILSTLHDIQSRQDRRWLSSRIASRLPVDFPHPSEAFPIRLREVSLFLLAAVLVVATVFIVNIPARTEPVTETLPVAPIELNPDNVTAFTPDAVGETANPSEQQPSDPAESSTPGSSDPVSLSEILSSIRLDGSGESASTEGSDETVLRPRPRAEITLDSILRQLEEGLRESGVQVLSPDEIATLQAFQDSAPSEVAEALEQLIEASDNAEALERISDFLSDPELLESSQELAIPATDNLISSSRDIDSPEDASMPMLEATSDEQGSPAFVPTTLPSSESDEGSYLYYLTKGVPTEPPIEPGETTISSDLELSFEQIDTIVSGRALAPDVLDTVRAYFDRIAGGGS